MIYLGQEVDQAGIMNINGAMFLLLTNTTFQNMFAVVNVSHIKNLKFNEKMALGIHTQQKQGDDLSQPCQMLSASCVYRWVSGTPFCGGQSGHSISNVDR